MPDPGVLHYRGRPVSELSREELIEAVHALYAQLESERQSWNQDRRLLTEELSRLKTSMLGFSVVLHSQR